MTQQYRRMSARQKQELESMLAIYKIRVQKVIEIRADIEKLFTDESWYDEEQIDFYYPKIRALDEQHEFVYDDLHERLMGKK